MKPFIGSKLSLLAYLTVRKLEPLPQEISIKSLRTSNSRGLRLFFASFGGLIFYFQYHMRHRVSSNTRHVGVSCVILHHCLSSTVPVGPQINLLGTIRWMIISGNSFWTHDHCLIISSVTNKINLVLGTNVIFLPF